MSKLAQNRDVKAAKSQEYIDDSSDDSGSDNKSGTISRVTGASAKAQAKNSPQVESSDESDSEKSITSSDSQQHAATKRGREISSAYEGTPVKRTKIVTQSPRSKNDQFKPPLGYNPIELSATDMVSEAGNMFSNPDGKQIWHITAPASLPITSIQSLDIPAALRGESILQHEGVGYSMFAASSKGESLLMPHGTKSIYSNPGLEISRSFHLREGPQNDKDMADDDSARSENMEHQHYFATSVGTHRAPREQPSGLLMRYQPFGGSTTSSVPYRLDDPDVNDEKQNIDTYGNTLMMPPVSRGGESQIRISTPNKAKNHSKSKRKDTPNKHLGSDRGEIETDAKPNDVEIGTPRMKTKTNGAISGSDEKREEKRKRKKESREKA